MHHGALQAVGAPEELKAGLTSEASPTPSLEDVFRHYAGSDLAEDTRRGLQEIRSSRRTARRVS
jgi:ABC-2 type transport system ATP-binding protein